MSGCRGKELPRFTVRKGLARRPSSLLNPAAAGPSWGSLSLLSSTIPSQTAAKLPGRCGCSARTGLSERSRRLPRALIRRRSASPAGAGAGAGADGSCQPQQLQEKLQVLVGQTFTLCCTVAGDAAAGAVKWLKPSGGRNETIYAQKGSFPRVTRAANGSNTDFTIHISDARPEDAGTYYCVKLQAGSEERVSCSGAGTAVSVHAPVCRTPRPQRRPASDAAGRTRTFTTPTCSTCPRPRAGRPAPAPPAPSTPASG
ncbi:signal-regulatory protein delta-like isoform X4 [Apteryx mantelli]|uniref:Signal-regulatory protein delta-like isoform X4 n=1 Tax=Apteryx mantelli TaxID=2696672 RepID=A0ABM4FG35_9AVES